jgi:hypothetical protein
MNKMNVWSIGILAAVISPFLEFFLIFIGVIPNEYALRVGFTALWVGSVSLVVMGAYQLHHSLRVPPSKAQFANLEDINRLEWGTAEFAFQGVEYKGTIAHLNYVPLGPGGINVTLLSLQPVHAGPAVPDIPLDFTISLFMADVGSTSNELIVRQLVPQAGFGNNFVFTVKEEK